MPTSTGMIAFAGTHSRTRVEVSYPADVTPGTKVWFIAQWANPRGETGPASAPYAAVINYGGVRKAA